MKYKNTLNFINCSKVCVKRREWKILTDDSKILTYFIVHIAIAYSYVFTVNLF